MPEMAHLRTPAVLIDKAIARRHLDRMQAEANASGVRTGLGRESACCDPARLNR